MKIGVTGASGMLGTALLSQISKSHEIYATSRSKGFDDKNIKWDCFDLTDKSLLSSWLNKTKPDVLIHCAAIVNVDLCEENINLAKALHIETTRVISDYMSFSKGRLIYISTDSVFNGEKSGSYNELDTTNPLNVYAKTKLQGEEIVQSLKNGLILRTNIIGWTNQGKTSFFEWLLKSLFEEKPINLFDDVYFSPLTVHDFSLIIDSILLNPIFGLYHCASSDDISKYAFGIEVSEIFQLPSFNIKRASVDIMNFKAARPKNMALDVSKISLDLSYNLPSISDSIQKMKSQYENIKSNKNK